MKYSWQFKFECVVKYKEGIYADRSDYTKCSTTTFKQNIRLWNRLYDQHGIEGLKHKIVNKEWSNEEKYQLIAKTEAGRSIKRWL